MAADVDDTVVGAYLNDIVVGQTYISCQPTVLNELIDIDDSDELAVAINLDVAQCAQVADASSHIQGMEHG